VNWFSGLVKWGGGSSIWRHNITGSLAALFGLPSYFTRVAAEACVLAMNGATDLVARFR